VATRKIQVPAVGGVRKVIQPAAGSNATTIAGLEGQTLTVAQLKTLIGNTGTTVQGGSSGAAPGAASLIVGPGLTGGGALIGAVPVGLRFPTPPVMWTDSLLPDDFIAPVGGGSSGGGSLATLSDVLLAALTSGQVLTYNGSKWVNQTPTGGGGGTAVITGNVTPDLHPSSPDPINDEFETTVFNTNWALVNSTGGTSTSTAANADGSAVLQSGWGSVDHPFCLTQPISAATWTVQAKCVVAEGSTVDTRVGLYVGLGGSGKFLAFGIFQNSQELYVNAYTNPNSFSATQKIASTASFIGITGGWMYLQIQYDGTNIVFSCSNSGVPGSWVQVWTETAASFLGGAPTAVGLFSDSNQHAASPGLVDWFRRSDTSGTVPASLILPYNLTPDSHPSSPTAWDDEFEFGTSIDLTGARFSGANPWTVVGSGGTLSSVVAGGGLASLTTNGGSTTTGTFYSQPVPSGNFQITWKGYLTSLCWYNSSGFKGIYWGWNGSSLQLQSETRNVSTNSYTFGSTLATAAWNSLIPVYLQVEVNGTNIIFRYSASGMPGTFITASTQALSSWIVTLTNFAILANGGSPTTTTTAMDWIRRTA
jgi:hypothetical protein